MSYGFTCPFPPATFFHSCYFLVGQQCSWSYLVILYFSNMGNQGDILVVHILAYHIVICQALLEFLLSSVWLLASCFGPSSLIWVMEIQCSLGGVAYFRNSDAVEGCFVPCLWPNIHEKWLNTLLVIWKEKVQVMFNIFVPMSAQF